MGDQLVGLFEGAFVEQELDAFAGRHLALFVFAGAAFFAATRLCKRVAALQFGQFLCKVHGGNYIGERRSGREVNVTGACDTPGPFNSPPRAQRTRSRNGREEARAGFLSPAGPTLARFLIVFSVLSVSSVVNWPLSSRSAPIPWAAAASFYLANQHSESNSRAQSRQCGSRQRRRLAWAL